MSADPTAAELTDLRDEVAGVVAAHQEDFTYPNTCLCENEVPECAEGHYARHLADALMPLIAQREAAARAEERERAARRIEAAARRGGAL